MARHQLMTDLEQARSHEVTRATHDSLTGLSNRLLFFDRLTQARERCLRSGTHFAIVFIDLDGFKQVNDSAGHAAGDEVLREAARRLSANVRASDTIARLGGDEFTVIYEGIPNRPMADRLLASLHETFRAPILVNGVEHQIAISAGLAIYPDDGDDVQVLLERADTMMYEAKASNRLREPRHLSKW